MIVVDSSVWIEVLHNLDLTPIRAVAPRIEQVVVGDLVLLEVLQGARSESHAARLERNLRAFEVVPMMGDLTAVHAAMNYRYLRRQGITVKRTVDLIIATFCIENNHEFMHKDRDFTPFETHLGLKVLR